MREIKQHGVPPCFLCAGTERELIADIRNRPLRETDFGIPPESYLRSIYRCRRCGVFYNVHRMLDSSIYRRAYNEATYRLDLQDKYASIRALPEDRSDNKQRVRRVIAFSKRMGQRPQKASVLDIGSGLCVFLGEMKDVGYSCFCLDPDPFAVDHALKTVCVDGAYAGTLDDYKPDRAFDIITLNKVLEHVPDPARMLKQAAELLAPNGFIYIELPDGEAALKEGAAFDREEFYIEHFTIFTWDSFRRLTEMAGVKVVEMESIHEPSDKFTLYGFLVGGKEEYE